MTAWLYECAEKRMSKHSRIYSSYQMDIGSGAFKRAFVKHWNAATTAVKRTTRTNGCLWEKKRRNVERRPGKKCDVVPPKRLLQE